MATSIVASSAEETGGSGELVTERKDAHLDLCLHRDVGSPATTGLGGYTFEYDALPEVDLQDVDLRTTLLGRELSALIVVGAMTGGTARAQAINRRLARAAAATGIGMALRSQRAMIVRPELTETFVVRDAAPDLRLLFANVGAVQLNYGVTTTDIARLIDAVNADAINFHLNPLQEAIQPEGDTRFGGLAGKLGSVVEALHVPCMVKEVGAGIGVRAAEKLAQLPIAGIEVAGCGGTSWAKVESYRAPAESAQRTVGRRLAGFGVPTAASIRICRKALGDRTVIASGGIRTGMDVAVALALGADAAALARPLLEAAAESETQAVRVIEALIYELKVVLFCTGARNLAELRRRPLLAPGQAWPVPHDGR